MRFFFLISFAALIAIILTGCERQITSQIINTVEHQEIDTQFAQMALLDFADTATAQGFINLANAATGFVEALATEDLASVQPTFSKLTRFASEVTYLESSFANAGCSIELRTFAEASVDTIRAYTIRDTTEMDRALQNLAQEAETASMALQQLSTISAPFRPFVFAYSPRFVPKSGSVLGRIELKYKKTDVAIVDETNAAVVQFLNSKGYRAKPIVSFDQERWNPEHSHITLGAQVNTRFIIEEFGEELRNIPNVMYVEPAVVWLPYKTLAVEPPHVNELSRFITNSISGRYNKAWCQGNLDVNAIDNILIEKSGLDFFNYTFLRNLADIYAEEKPETIERIGSNMFSFRSIALHFLGLYFHYSGKTDEELIEMYSQYRLHSYPIAPEPEGFDGPFQVPEKTLDEIIELFRQSVRRGVVHIAADKAPNSYYHWYWK